jgi:uncharacterized protein (TIGR02001 family)
MNHRVTALACALLLAAPFAAQAEDESPLTWEVTGVSDYVFRGASQSDEDPALQAGLTYSHDSGFYVGSWASTVDFGTSKPDAEVDVFVGYNTDLNDSVNFDVALNRYLYPSAGAQNYNELITTTTFAETYSATVAYSNNVWNSDTDGWYFAVGGEWALPQEFSLNAGVGYSTFDEEVAENYVDWSLGVSRAFGPATIGLTYHGTNSKGEYNFGETADDRVVLSVSFGN